MQKIKISDEVIILTGKDKKKTGKVQKINWKTNRVFVEGINLVKKAVKPTQEAPNGGIVEKEASIHISNIALMSPSKGVATRVGFKVNKDGTKIRISKKCGKEL